MWELIMWFFMISTTVFLEAEGKMLIIMINKIQCNARYGRGYRRAG